MQPIKNKGKNYYFDACVDRARRMYDKKVRFEEYISLHEMSDGVLEITETKQIYPVVME